MEGVDHTNSILVPDQDLLLFLGAYSINTLSEAWVDFGFTEIENRSIDNPFDTLTEALGALADSATVRIKGDTGTTASDESLIIEQAVTVEAVNGTVQIGRLSGSASTIYQATGFVTRD